MLRARRLRLRETGRDVADSSRDGKIAQPAFDESSLWLVLRKVERPLVRDPRLVMSPEAPQQVGPGRVRQVVIVELSTSEDAINEG